MEGRVGNKLNQLFFTKYPEKVWGIKTNEMLADWAPQRIEVREKSKDLTMVVGSMLNKEREIPDYIQLDEKNKKAKLIRVPKFSEVPYPTIMEPNLVVEYYSR